MTNLQKFLAWNKERQRKNRVAVLTAFVAFIPTYFVATQFTSNHEDVVFFCFMIAIIIGVSFGPWINRFLGQPTKKREATLSKVPPNPSFNTDWRDKAAPVG